MAWQDMIAGSTTRINAEYEQELHLAAQARLGADWALGALIARYQPTVTRYLTRLTGTAPRAQVLSEEIFLRMERRLHGPHGGQHLRLWLLRACTELGLDELRRPNQSAPRIQLSASGSHPRALLPDVAQERPVLPDAGATGRIRAGLGALAGRTGSTGRQLRQLIWSPWSNLAGGVFPEGADERHLAQGAPGNQWDTIGNGDSAPNEEDALPPRELLRYRMIRAVLAELPYGDAQCLALHLIANLNQAEVARALGITGSATRRRIVSGLQLFAQRYEAVTASLGISLDTLEGTQTAEDEEEPFTLSAGAESDGAIYREPIVVSAPLTAPLRMDTGVSEETTVVWDLPPFADFNENQPQVDSAIVSAPVEEPRTTAEEEVTRRLMWSRPSAHRQTPITSGDAVTTRLTRPAPATAREDSSAMSAEKMHEVWTYSEHIETIIEPPPPNLVVDAAEPVRTVPVESDQARVVPILTTHANQAVPLPGSLQSQESHLDAENSQGNENGQIGDVTPTHVARTRIISVLTPVPTMSPEDTQVLQAGPDDDYRPTAR